MSLLKLSASYFGWLNALTRKIRTNSAASFSASVLLFLVNQLSIVLAFFLPLKVIIMVGSEGIPRYLKSVVTQENKDEFISYLAVAALVCYLISILTELMMDKLSASAVSKILKRAHKAAFINRQSEFARDVFIKVARTWGTYLMVSAGFIVGFLLEWRLFAVLVVALALEYALIGWFWVFSERAENIRYRLAFSQHRQKVLSTFSAVNFFIGFAVLFYLFLSGDELNFVVAILMILILRQIFQRMLVAINDAIFFVEQRRKIEATYYTHAYLEMGRKHIEHAFDAMLTLEKRSQVIAHVLSELPVDADVSKWEWADCPVPGVFMFKSEQVDDNKTYWIKCYPAHKKLMMQRERLIYKRESFGVFKLAPLMLKETD